MKITFSFWSKIARLMLLIALGSACAAQAQDGVMTFGKVKLRGPVAKDVMDPQEPYLFGQFFNANPKDGPLRIQAKVKNAQGKTTQAMIEVRGSIDEITRVKTFPVARYGDTPHKAFIKFDDGGNFVCTPKDGGTVHFTNIGNEGETISGTYSGVKWFSDQCQATLTGSGSFKVQRAENHF
jgi:hypothetical protein